MARSTYAPDDAADVFLNAYRAHRLLEELPEEIRPITLAEGYDVQDRLVARLGQVSAGNSVPEVRIPTEAGHLFRREAIQRSDWMPATVPR